MKLLSKEELMELGVLDVPFSTSTDGVGRCGSVHFSYKLTDEVRKRLKDISITQLAYSLGENVNGRPIPGYGCYNVNLDEETGELTFHQSWSCD